DDQLLVPEVSRDEVEGYDASRDFLPGSAFTPDSRALVAAWGGKIWRVEVPGGRATQIPFSADVDQMIGALSRFEYEHDDTALVVHQIRSPKLSPDGRRIAFVALEHVYVMDADGSGLHRVTPFENVVEHSPTWSPDGRW